MSNTFVLKDVMDFTVEKYSSTTRGDILFTVEYAKSSNVNTTAERLVIRGSGNNYRIMDIDHTKDVMFNSNLPLVDIKALAVKLGVDVGVGAATAVNKEILSASASNTITLAQTPLAGTLKVYKLSGERDLGTEQTVGTPGTTVNQYSIADKVITLNATTAPVTAKFIVFYEYTSGITAQKLKITADDFPKFITISGRAFVDDDILGQKVPVSFKVNKAKVKPEFELTMTGDAATEITFECDCYATLNSANEKEFISIVKLNDESV